MPFSRERLLLFLLPAALLAVSSTPPHGRSMGIAPPFLDLATPWADSVFSTLSLDDRIAQLMMVAAYSNKDAKHEAGDRGPCAPTQHRWAHLLPRWSVAPGRTSQTAYQAAARTPLLIGMDLEWGLAMRLDSTIRFPRQMTLGALKR
jgi:beta-N-acetylhexosaminidase